MTIDVARRLEELAEGHDRMAAPFTFKGNAKYPAPKTGNREHHENAAKTLREAQTLVRERDDFREALRQIADTPWSGVRIGNSDASYHEMKRLARAALMTTGPVEED